MAVTVDWLQRFHGFRFEDGPPDDFRDLRDDGVSEGSKTVHPRGNPISHSTHIGFNAPVSPAMVKALPKVNPKPLPFFAVALHFSRLAINFARSVVRISFALGVGHNATAVAKLIPFACLVRLAKSGPDGSDRGVGQIVRADTASTSVPPSRPFVEVTSPPWSARVAVGVGHDPDAVASVRSANGRSGYTVPFCVIPERSDFPEHLIQSARAKGTDVFDDDPRRPAFFDEPTVLGPEAGSLAAESDALACGADVLARKSSANNVNWSDIGCS